MTTFFDFERDTEQSMNNSIVVDVVIPTYNRAGKLVNAIKSAQAQKYRNLRIIVIDNNSSDETDQVINKLAADDARIVCVRNSTNIGLVANVRKAFDLVESEFFCVLTDDDYLTPNFISDALGVFATHPQIGFIALGSVFVDENLNLVGPTKDCVSSEVTVFDESVSFVEMSKFSRPYSLISVLFKKELADLYLKINTIDDIGADMRFFMHAAAKYNWAYLAKIGACVTVHADSHSVKKELVDWKHDAVQISRYIEIMKFNPDKAAVQNACLDLIAKELMHDRRRYYFRSLILDSLVRLKNNGFEVNSQRAHELSEFSRSGRGLPYWVLYLVNYSPPLRLVLSFLLKLFVRSSSMLGMKKPSPRSDITPAAVKELRSYIKMEPTLVSCQDRCRY